MDNSSDGPALDWRLRCALRLVTRGLGILLAVDEVSQVALPDEGLYLPLELKIVFHVMIVVFVEVTVFRSITLRLDLLVHLPKPSEDVLVLYLH